MASELSREFLAERDTRIYKLRATGVAPSDIAKRMEVSESTVNNAISRHLRRAGQNGLNVVEVIVMELDRLDTMQAAIFPYTQTRRVKLADDTEVVVEPDIRYVDTVIKLMQQRAKLLGLDVQRTIDLTESAAPIEVTSTLKGETLSAQEDEVVSVEDETRAMLKLAMEAGIIEETAYDAMLGDDPVEAEIVEDSDEPVKLVDVEETEDDS